MLTGKLTIPWTKLTCGDEVRVSLTPKRLKVSWTSVHNTNQKFRNRPLRMDEEDSLELRLNLNREVS